MGRIEVIVADVRQTEVVAQLCIEIIVLQTTADAQTTIEPLEGEDRVSEIARMLSGDSSAASLAHAREMLSTAHQ